MQEQMRQPDNMGMLELGDIQVWQAHRTKEGLDGKIVRT